MNALLALHAPPLEPVQAAGQVVRAPSLLLGGFDALLAEVAGELVGEMPLDEDVAPMPSQHDELDEGMEEPADGRHVFAAADLSLDALWSTPQREQVPSEAPRLVDLGALGDEAYDGRASAVLGPADALDSAVVAQDVLQDVTDLGAASTETIGRVSPAREPSAADESNPSEEPLDATSSMDAAPDASANADAPQEDASDHDGGASTVLPVAPEPSSAVDAAAALEELVVDAQDVVTPELSAELPHDSTVRVQVDDDLAVEVTQVDGEVDITLLGADAVKPVMKTVESDLRDALKRGGYELGQFERHDQDAPRERRRRHGSRQSNTPDRRPRGGVLL